MSQNSPNLYLLFLKNSDDYKLQYLQKTGDTLQTDKDIIKFIFKKVILKSSLAEQVFEDMFIYWPVDKDVLQALIAKTFKNFASDDFEQNKLAEVTGNWEEDREFIVNLFEDTIRYNEDYQQLISAKTQNWEPDRIAMMDTLLMKMAIAEFINFNSIPVKVTINEYLEISKEFSTPKSNSFINGILDKILFELKEQKKGKQNRQRTNRINTMKKLFLGIIAAGMLMASCTQPDKAGNGTTAGNTTTANAADAPSMKFDKDTHDFGKIKSGDKVTYDFKFINAGKSPLIITDAVATCGCTKPEWPKTPVKPGESGVIHITFNSAE